MVKEKKMKLQWRRFKLATAGMIVIAFIAVILLYTGIMAVLEKSNVGYAMIFFSAVLFAAVGYDIYRMYGY